MDQLGLVNLVQGLVVVRHQGLRVRHRHPAGVQVLQRVGVLGVAFRIVASDPSWRFDPSFQVAWLRVVLGLDQEGAYRLDSGASQVDQGRQEAYLEAVRGQPVVGHRVEVPVQ